MKKKYKVWLHLEEIKISEADGAEYDYKSLDEEILPLPAGEFLDKEQAIKHMEHIWDYYSGRYYETEKI